MIEFSESVSVCIFDVPKPHCIRCSHFKVDDVSALEPSSKPPVRIVEDNVTASLQSATYTVTLVTAWKP
jgi:hypothetical protein